MSQASHGDGTLLLLNSKLTFDLMEDAILEFVRSCGVKGLKQTVIY